MLRRLFIVLALMLPLPAEAAEGGWQSPLLTGHPLAGRIWSRQAQAFITPEALLHSLAGARFIGLGEKHDNPDHHRLQAWVLARLTEGPRRPAVLWEMIEPEQEADLAAFLAARPASAAGLGDALGWEAHGWPAWTLYAPIADVALKHGLPMAGANLSRPLVKAIARQGRDALPAALRTRLGLDGAPDPTRMDAMAAEIAASHCHALPALLTRTMAQAQEARDAMMALRLAEAATSDGAVLIAGAGHLRNDRAVPAHLARQAAGAAMLTLAFVEVVRGEDNPTAYGDADGLEGPSFDFVWFTPRVDEDDPCARFRNSGREKT